MCAIFGDDRSDLRSIAVDNRQEMDRWLMGLKELMVWSVYGRYRGACGSKFG